MPRATRQRREPTDEWAQLRLLTRFPEQLTDELIRPVVLFGSSPAERARQTGAPQRTLYRQVARFETDGMASLFPPAAHAAGGDPPGDPCAQGRGVAVPAQRTGNHLRGALRSPAQPAHRQARPGRGATSEVLAWVCGRQVTPEELHR